MTATVKNTELRAICQTTVFCLPV